jgi:hypothetical protein
MRRWRLFWNVVKLDLDGVTFPTPPIGSSSEHEGPFHQPLFIYVCPVCEAREPSYFRSFFGAPLPGLSKSSSWIHIVLPTKPIDRLSRRGPHRLVRGNTPNMFDHVVCSTKCQHVMEERYPRAWIRVEELWGQLGELDTSGLDVLASGYSIDRMMGGGYRRTDEQMRNELVLLRRRTLTATPPGAPPLWW